ncbi:MAG: hypothetical protein HZY74_06380 [Brevundimonas sp.]|nr:MAG: hypothetical protein HZY74_06380 [Brevundimonas sp.]
MDDVPKTPKPTHGNAGKPTKDQRLAKALRDNLRRRKVSAKGKSARDGSDD